MRLVGVGGVPFGEASLANTEDVRRQKPPASTGNNFKIPFVYHSVFSIPVKEGGALYQVLLMRLGDAVHRLGQGGPWKPAPAGVQRTYKSISCNASHVHEGLPGSWHSLGICPRRGGQEKPW